MSSSLATVLVWVAIVASYVSVAWLTIRYAKSGSSDGKPGRSPALDSIGSAVAVLILSSYLLRGLELIDHWLKGTKWSGPTLGYTGLVNFIGCPIYAAAMYVYFKRQSRSTKVDGDRKFG